jgi:acyl-homoserine lactone acylase PvdQ
MITAYTAGINAFIKQGHYPLQFTLIHYTPQPWTVIDSIVWQKLLAWDLNQALRDKVKYCPDNEDPQAYEAIRNKLHELLEEYKLNLD